MKILFCAYRDWALQCVEKIKEYIEVEMSWPDIYVSTEPDKMEVLARSMDWDMIILIGWSWKVPADIVNKTFVVGMHPSDLPKYAGGTPIQHQILDGLKTSMASIFRLTEKFDDGEIVCKVPYSLEGHLSDVFSSLSTATFNAVLQTIQTHPNQVLTKQGSGGFVRRRLKPEHSKITSSHLSGLTCKQLYDFIRCREDPYPNAYLEDETGRLLIKLAEFEPK